MLKFSEWILRFIFKQDNRKSEQVFGRKDFPNFEPSKYIGHHPPCCKETCRCKQRPNHGDRARTQSHDHSGRHYPGDTGHSNLGSSSCTVRTQGCLPTCKLPTIEVAPRGIPRSSVSGWRNMPKV